MRQFLTESAMLAVFGGAGSVAVAYVTLRLLRQFVATRRSDPIIVGFGANVLWIVFATTLVALLLFGVFPAWRATRAPSAGSIEEQRRKCWV